MGIAIYPKDITNLKDNIGEKIGQKIIIRGSAGRNKPFEEEATISKTYPSLFEVKYDEQNRSVTFQYKDVLTRAIDVQVFDGTGYSPLIPPVVS
ncbi:MAG: Veg family protein [Lachnospiraceae bacterium]|jgi:uncharacterized protein Veg|nr:Veg family protein [Lachnospiraceae bacterium]